MCKPWGRSHQDVWIYPCDTPQDVPAIPNPTRLQLSLFIHLEYRGEMEAVFKHLSDCQANEGEESLYSRGQNQSSSSLRGGDDSIQSEERILTVKVLWVLTIVSSRGN